MSLRKIQGRAEKLKGIYYEFDSNDKPLGEGGMGKVYKGRCVDETTGSTRNVAIKFLYSDLPEYAIEKARREAAMQFRHDNLIEMLGFIETEERSVLGEQIHRYHVVSELLEGVSLDSMFEGKLVDQQGHPVPFAEKLYRDFQQDPNHFAVEIVKNILSGLMMMHDAGYIHRDIDPTNIMLTKDGHIKLIDFGIAKKMNSLTTGDKSLTQAGQFVGKADSAAPELVLGSINEQNQTTDIYAVGILLFKCIVGHFPFEGDSSDILQKQLHSSMPLKLIKNKALREVVAKATEKSRSKRFQSAAEFRVALERVKLDDGGFEWKPLYSYIIGGVAACTIAGAILVNIKHNQEQDTSGTTAHQANIEEISYPATVTALYSASASDEALENLKKLSDDGNAQATYLLSRLYYNYKSFDYCPDSIQTLQNMLNIPRNDAKAHELLLKSVEQDSADYHSLYELACDYWKADQRTQAVENREGNLAKSYFDKARNLALQANDKKYVKMIEAYLSDYQRWLERVRKNNISVK